MAVVNATDMNTLTTILQRTNAKILIEVDNPSLVLGDILTLDDGGTPRKHSAGKCPMIFLKYVKEV